jgi:hypothetical protein
MVAIPVDLEFVLMMIQVVIVLVTSFIVLQLVQRFLHHITEEKIKVTKGRLIHVNRFF